MARASTHVTPNGGNGWRVQQGGGERASAILPTKVQAIERAREISQNQHTELVIHNRNGQIASSDSHGHDPFPPRG